jgi:redox-sensitive bicupin YhaK (pirin superfamily)
MRILRASDVDITGFASIRERVMLSDRQTFGFGVADECFDRFAGCVYLANAWFLPYGETGLHHHAGMDIISLIPRGCMLHQGSLGAGVRVEANQVQLQRDGEQGFRHNESNPNAGPQPLLQLWIKPQPHAPQAEYRIIDVSQGGCVYGGPLFTSDTRVDVVVLSTGECYHCADECLICVVRGELLASEPSVRNSIAGGDLMRGADVQLTALSDTMLLLVTG